MAPEPTNQPINFFDPTNFLKHIEVREGMKIADFGAGNGHIAFKVAEIVGDKGIVYALDIKKNIIAHLENEAKHQGLHQVKPVWTDLEMIHYNPIASETVDIVLIINMLFQSNKHAAVLKEAYRILAPGGIVVIVDWKKTATPFGPPPDERVTLEKIKQIAYTIGLNRIKEFEPDPYHFGIVLRK
jgi:ubiquinone/menaquinone biosynthesis C-methylase UbiE